MPDDLDFRADLHAHYRDDDPEWHAAIDYGIDLSLLERNLALIRRSAARATPGHEPAVRHAQAS